VSQSQAFGDGYVLSSQKVLFKALKSRGGDKKTREAIMGEQPPLINPAPVIKSIEDIFNGKKWWLHKIPYERSWW
jgi:hypothetical protein